MAILIRGLRCDYAHGNERYSTVHEQKSSVGSIGTSSDGVRKEKCERKYEFQLSVTAGPAGLNGVLHVPTISHSLVSVADLCNGGRTAQLTKNSCIHKIKKGSVGVGQHTDGMYAVDFKKARSQQSFAPRKDVRVLDV